MTQHSILALIVILLVLGLAIFLLPGCSVNGKAMRFDPLAADTGKEASWYIEGKTTNDARVSCSFVEFDERGDFIEFRQHTDCQEQIRMLAQSNRLLVVIYC